MDINLIEEQIEIVNQSFDESFTLYEEMGVEKERIDEAKNMLVPALHTLVLLVPTLILFSALINAVAAYLTAQWIFPKLQMKIPKFPPFAEWKFPPLFMYSTIIGGLGMYWGYTRDWVEIYEISLNLLIISSIVGLIQGLALLSFMFDRWKISKLVRRILYAILLLNAFLFQIVAITGLMDMLFDYRKRFFEGRE